MQLKSLLTIATVSVAAMAVADTTEVTSQNTMCRIEVSGSANQNSLIIAVPLCAVGGDAVAITDLVMTNNLENGDALIARNGDAWQSWVIQDGAWTAATTTAGGTATVAGSAESSTLPRGSGVWLVRKTPTNAAYLYGEFATDSVTTTAEAGTASNGKYTLMGNPTAKTKSLNGITWANIAVGDQIAVAGTGGTTKVYVCKNLSASEEEEPALKWCTYVRGTGWTATEDTIAPGMGLWYISFGGGENAPSATW